MPAPVSNTGIRSSSFALPHSGANIPLFGGAGPIDAFRSLRAMNPASRSSRFVTVDVQVADPIQMWGYEVYADASGSMVRAAAWFDVPNPTAWHAQVSWASKPPVNLFLALACHVTRPLP